MAFEWKPREGLNSLVGKNVSASVWVEHWLKLRVGWGKAQTSSQLREGSRAPAPSLGLALSEWNRIRSFPALWGS